MKTFPPLVQYGAFFLTFWDLGLSVSSSYIYIYTLWLCCTVNNVLADYFLSEIPCSVEGQPIANCSSSDIFGKSHSLASSFLHFASLSCCIGTAEF